MSDLFTLIHDPNFRAKVELSIDWLLSLPEEPRALARLSMLDIWTRDQAMVYAATAADIESKRFGMDAEERSEYVYEAVRRVQLDYDTVCV